ncbi:radical SAM protein [Clostridiaceae bacterium M8S5]|nr:radical SAM protein [Clostridiaceae bacterium M8S5]
MKLNLLKFNELDREWIFIGNYNILLQSTNLIDDIICLLENDMNEQDMIKELAKNYNKEEAQAQVRIIKESLDSSIEHKKKYLDKIYNVTHQEWLDGKLLRGLFMNISNDCNLRCKYCYGDGGSYGFMRQVMDIDMAKKTIDYWLRYANLNEKLSVIFFGGEPLLNKKVLVFSVNYINECLKKFNKKTTYSITTNGTILDEDILTLFSENDFRVTVSIDGDETFHNDNRPYVSGKGSYITIKENIYKLIEKGINVSARLTLTHDKVKNLYESVNSIWNIGIDKVNFDLVISENETYKITHEDIKDIKQQVSKLANITYDSIINDNNKVLQVLMRYVQAIHGKVVAQTCGYNSLRALMVNTNGEVFRCHRLLGNDKFTAGNIEKGIDWDRYTTDVDLSCSTCWADSICNKCAQINYSCSGDVKKVYDIWCNFRKILMKESLKLYVRLNAK